MEKNRAIFVNRTLSDQLRQLAETVKAPVEMLRSYYSQTLERELNMRQTWLLLNAQAAFLCAVFPVESPILLRAVCCVWFLHAVLKCKREL